MRAYNLNIFDRILSNLIIILFPFILILTVTRIVTGSQKVMIYEYKRENFPKDRFGFIVSDRVKYGPLFLDYLLQKKKKINFLGDLTFTNGKKMFNERELNHMKDVKTAISKIMKIGYFLFFGYLLLLLLFLFREKYQFILLKNLFFGGVWSILLLSFLAVFAFFFWDKFFDLAHKLMGFKPRSWIFYESDTLIRLFPLRYWVDMFTIVLSIVVGFSISTVLFCFYLLKKSEKF